MELQSLEAKSNVPSVSLLVKLATPTEEHSADGVQILADLLRRLELPATWVIGEARQAKLLADRQLAASGHDLALTVAARSPQRLRTELANLQGAVRGVTGQKVSVVVGDPGQLRSRAALLADLGINAVVSDSRLTGPAKPARQLPCGLWQFDPIASIPQLRSRWSWLPTRRPSVKQLLATDSTVNQKLVAIDLGRVSSHELRGCVQLLQEISASSRRLQLGVANLSEFATQLASEHKVRPQRSILRRVA